MTAVKFNIETITVNAPSRQLKCKCGSEKSYLASTLERARAGQYTMRCDGCISDGEYPINFGYEEAPPAPAEYHEDVLETVYKALLNEIIEEMKNEQSNRTESSS